MNIFVSFDQTGRPNDKRWRRYLRVDSGIMGGESYVFNTFFSNSHLINATNTFSDNLKSVFFFLTANRNYIKHNRQQYNNFHRNYIHKHTNYTDMTRK